MSEKEDKAELNGVEYVQSYNQQNAPDNTKKVFKIITITLIILIAGLIVFLIGKTVIPKISGKEDMAKKEAMSEDTIFPVNTIEAKSGSIVDYLNISGDIIASYSADVYPDAQWGKLVSIQVNQGTYVRKGAVIAMIDPSRPGMNFALSPVRAPVNGTITYINDNIGASVSSQAPVATIGNLSDLVVRVYIAEKYVSKLSLGMDAELTLSGIDGKSFPAKIKEISPILDASSRTLEVKLSISDPESLLKAGMFAKVKLLTEKKDAIVKVPSDCVLERFGHIFVYVLDGEMVRKQAVTKGIEIDDYTEIVEGVQIGDKVVYEGQTLLDDGVKVIVKKEINLNDKE